ncbi:MAG: dTDP-4-dehydrorhamnose reductase [Candidatus Sumerlaeia bacterium]|nr:dTDP-4-dehydrorhamnose reductase [Candidatus Sumerlaeia bacterium]
MKIAIIGAAGQVGQEFLKHCPPDNLVLWDIEDFDITQYEAVEKALRSRPDLNAVVNLAAFHNVNQCEEQPALAYAVNATGAYNVAKAAARLGLKVVFFASDYVFGQDRTRRTPYVESDPVGPLNIYGASKVAGEHLVRAMNPNHLIVRTSSLFGVVTSKKGWTFPEMIVNRARAGQPLKVVTDQVMAPTYTYHLVEKVLELLEKNITGTIHVSNAGECSWHQFAAETLALLNMDYPIAECTSDAFPSPALRPAYSVLSSERMKPLGIAPLPHWKEALKQYLQEKGWLQ